MEIGDKLRKLRGNTSQSRIAQELDISQTAYNKWESNKSTPTIANLIKLSKYYDKNLYEFVSLELKINFYDSQITAQNLINKNEVINQEFSNKYIKLYEKRICDLENEVIFWKGKYNEMFSLLKKESY
mgnify:CR=1 FL=1